MVPMKPPTTKATAARAPRLVESRRRAGRKYQSRRAERVTRRHEGLHATEFEGRRRFASFARRLEHRQLQQVHGADAAAALVVNDDLAGAVDEPDRRLALAGGELQEVLSG